jgi:formate dehydrogenase-N alpha subunit
VAAQPRVLYNRASADINGKPWDAKRMLIQWNGSKWVATIFRTSIPRRRAAKPGRLSCSRKGWGACLPDKLAEGPFPEHYEPMETPLGTNPLHPNVVSSPVVRLYEEDARV